MFINPLRQGVNKSVYPLILLKSSNDVLSTWALVFFLRSIASSSSYAGRLRNLSAEFCI